MTKNYSPVRSLELFAQYSRNPCLEIRNRLVQLNIGLVRQVAHRLSNQCLEPYEDLEQVGCLGLILAIERFQPQQGVAFSSFAIPYIRGEILHYLRDKAPILRIPRRSQELYSKGKNCRKQLELKLGRPAQEKEIAQALAVSLEEWKECQLVLQKCSVMSLDTTINQSSDHHITFVDTLPDYHGQVQQAFEEDRSELQDALCQLEPKTQAAIKCVLLQGLPRKQAAKRIGISPTTVTRHLNKGLEQLGNILQPQAA